MQEQDPTQHTGVERFERALRAEARASDEHSTIAPAGIAERDARAADALREAAAHPERLMPEHVASLDRMGDTGLHALALLGRGIAWLRRDV